MESANLILLDPNTNVNRVYLMTDLGDGTMQVEFGRMGAALIKKKYPISFWDDLLKKQLAQGYIDRSEEFGLSAKIEEKLEYKPISDETVRKFIDYLLSCSRKKIQTTYSVSYDQVSEKMIEAAQNLIQKISETTDIGEMRSCYISLFKVIPRKMKNVADNLPETVEEGHTKAFDEQSLLNTLKSVKNTLYQKVESDKTILDMNGLAVREVTFEELAQIKKYLGSESETLCKRAFRVENIRTENKFRDYIQKHNIDKKDIHFFYHGSGNANYWGIATEGLLLNPKAPITGKMFGYGIYFAPRAKKSIGYTDLAGSFWRGGHSNKAYLAVFKVAYKNADHTSTCRGYTGIHSAPKGHDAVYAHAGIELRNDEVIVYNESQITIQYLIELER